jgi:hypothetical protein
MTDSNKSLRATLDRVSTFLQAKEAEFKGGTVKAAAGNQVDGGSKLDITNKHTMTLEESVGTPAKQPAITDDANAQPNDGGTHIAPAPASGQDDSPLTRGHATDLTQPPAKMPVEKPLITDDANAKEAGAATLANSILGDIRAHQAAKKAAAPAPKPEQPKVAETPKAPEAPKVADAPAAAKVEPKVAAEEGPALELTTDVLAKIAAMVLATDEGADYVEQILHKYAGAEAAQETLGFLAEQSALAEKQAAEAMGAHDAEVAMQQQAYVQGQLDVLAKVAESQGKTLDQFLKELDANQGTFAKLGQEVADASIADLMGMQDAGGAAPADEISPEVAGSDPGADPTAAGGAEISPEELAQAVEMLVQEGTLDPNEAAAIMEALQGGADGGDAGGGLPPDAAAGAPPAAPAAEPPADKPAADKTEPKKEDKEAQFNPKIAEFLKSIRAVKSGSK